MTQTARITDACGLVQSQYHRVDRLQPLMSQDSRYSTYQDSHHVHGWNVDDDDVAEGLFQLEQWRDVVGEDRYREHRVDHQLRLDDHSRDAPFLTFPSRPSPSR